MSLTGTEQKPMAPAEYARVGGNRCPFCRSTDITGDSVTITEGGAHQECGCDNCGRSWTDTYKLTGYEEA